MTIFGAYDKAGLDAQYNNRALVPGHGEIIEKWTTDSAAVRQRLDVRLDLAYGPGARERLDLFPAGDSGAPIFAFIHGGYWQMMDKSGLSCLAEPFVAAGVNYAAIGYPLAPEAGLDEIVACARASLLWLWRNAAEYGGDADRIFVSGHSAGGHLTAMALTADWAALGRDSGGAPADLVKGGCAISGLYDLEPIRLTYLNEALGMDAEVARRNSPVHNLASASGHLILTVGDDESDEFHRQQANFLAGWQGRGLACEVVGPPGRNHFSVVNELAKPESVLHKAVIRQILQ